MTGSFISFSQTVMLHQLSYYPYNFLETLYIFNYKYFYIKMYIRICIVNKVITKTM